jgi:hypothetical protein
MNSLEKMVKILERFEKKPIEHMSMRDMLKITRKLSEDVEVVDVNNERTNKSTPQDQKYAQDQFNSLFSDMPVNIDFLKLEKYDDFVFWGGTINNVLKFVYIVPPINDKNTGVDLEKSDEFNENSEQNQEIVKRVESYYDAFNKYWIENLKAR